MRILADVAKALRVPAWTLLIPDFPFDNYRYDEKPPESMHALTHTAARIMEEEEDMVKMMVMEAISHSLCKVDEKRSHMIKDAQAKYIATQRSIKT